MKKYLLMFIVFLLVLVGDQVSKFYAFKNSWDFELFGLDWLKFETVTNTGIAFSINISGIWWWLLFAVVVIVFSRTIYFWYDWKKPREQLAAGLLMGGALGNIIDRLSHGFVIDYIKVGWWPSFNLADAAICVSVFVLIILCKSKKEI